MKLNTIAALKAGAAPMVLGLAMISSSAFAQAAAEADDANAETIVVTGSRIARPQTEASVPIAVVASDSITGTGKTNVSDALASLPISGQTAGTAASNFSNYDNGTATVNLRNLGSQRTLVLINGRRSVGRPGSSEVDLNNIATDLIERVEVATGGTSAVYGSDAVAGVVNIILNNKFSGLKLHLQDAISDKWDGNSILGSLTGGTDFADGAGHIVVNLSYNKDNAIRSSDREFSANDSPGKSSFAWQGLFDTSGDAAFSAGAGKTYTFDGSNVVKKYQGSAVDGYNRAQNRLLRVPVKRYSASLLGNYDLSDSTQAYFEATYVKSKSNGTIEPLAVDDQGNPGQSVFNYDGSFFLGIPVTNPFLPAQIAAAATTNGQSYVNFRKRSVGIFDRSPNGSRDYWRGVIGVRGDIGSNWKYDLSYEHSQVRDDTLSQSIMMNNYGASLNATTIGGQVVCADAAARAAGCVPINIFGFQTYSAAVLKWLSTYTGTGQVVPGAKAGDAVINDYLRKSYQDVASLNVSGSPFKLPGGDLDVAAGLEYHHEKAQEIYDPFTQSGLSAAQQATNTVGSYNSKEAYLEVRAPIFGGIPMVHDFTLEGAIRYINYSTAGSVWSYKFGGSYAPMRDLRFRAIYARAVRAPTVNELYQGLSQTAPQVIDPCDQNQGNGDTVRTGGLVALPAACATTPGISNYLKTHPNFTYSLAQIQTIFGNLGGNPNLQVEATNTFTAGLTLTPKSLRNFYLTADYYSVKVNNAVASVDQQISVDQCFQTGDPVYCLNVKRNANGFITQVDSLNINAASYKVSGLDVQMHYGFKTKLFAADDKFDFGIFYNHKFKQEQVPYAGGVVSDELGTANTYSSTRLGTGFKDQFTFDTRFTTGPFSFNYKLKYYSSVTASVGGADLVIPSYTYHDIQAKLAFGEGHRYEFYVGSNNLFDKQPPLIASGNSQWPGTNTVADTYDTVGRTVYAGIAVNF